VEIGKRVSSGSAWSEIRIGEPCSSALLDGEALKLPHRAGAAHRCAMGEDGRGGEILLMVVLDAALHLVYLSARAADVEEEFQTAFRISRNQ
jgi:hypothetical protein